MGRGNHDGRKSDAGNATDAATAYRHALKLCAEGTYGKALTVSCVTMHVYVCIYVYTHRREQWPVRLSDANSNSNCFALSDGRGGDR